MKNHVVVMARFAIDCLAKTSELTAQLTTTLGIETADLRLRIGLNSGPTTAGGELLFLIFRPPLFCRYNHYSELFS
jgi:hypothetical protein